MQSEDQLVPAGYVRLAEGHQIYVPVAWLNELQGSFRGKTKSCALKLMISGFFEPKDVTGKTGVQLTDTPLGKAVKGMFLLPTTFNFKKAKINKYMILSWLFLSFFSAEHIR